MGSSTLGRSKQSKLSSALTLVGVAGLAAFGSACLDRELKPLNPCLVSGVVNQISVQNVDKVDLLFVVDNSGSMREEQQALRVQFPRVIRSLTRGERTNPDGSIENFPPVRDLHLGVVSTDMGLLNIPGRAQLGCGDESRPLGDDGVLRNAPNPGGAAGLACANGYPPFLQFVLTGDAAQNDANATAIANDFSCIASLGTQGCGFEMQLESALRALWPANNILPGNVPGTFAPDNRPFLDGTPFGKGNPNGPNANFLRDDYTTGASLIAVVIVSDEEDCSSHNLGHFVPEMFLQAGDPLKTIGLNLRCYNEARRVGGDGPRDQGAANLYATSRYAQGLKALRPGQEKLVIFAGIVGIPTDLVNPNVDLTNEAARNGYYDSLLADNRLQEMEDPSTLSGNPNLMPSCLRNITDSMGNMVAQKAFPPRRFIKVAKEFGENATIQSICSDDFTPAVNQIIDIIARQLGAVCLPRKLTADSDGKVACDVIWELPMIAPNGETPIACAQKPGLLDPPPADRAQTGPNGGALCVVRQVPVVPCTGGAGCVNNKQPNQDPARGDTNGWYYDDFSDAVTSCTGAEKQRVAFFIGGTDAPPPSGVTVRLECLQQAASVIVPREDVEPSNRMCGTDDQCLGSERCVGTRCVPPGMGSPCETDPDCHVTLKASDPCIPSQFRAGGPGNCLDTQMFCHPQQKACVSFCNNKSECLPGFECDTRASTLMTTSPDGVNPGPAICVNPTCGE